MARTEGLPTTDESPIPDTGNIERFDQASLDEMSAAIADVINTQQRRFPDASPYELYQQIAEAIPALPGVREPELRVALASEDPQAARQAKEILIFTKLGSVLSAVDLALKYYPYLEDDFAQVALIDLLDNFPTDYTYTYVSQAVLSRSLHAIGRYIALLEGIPARYALNERFIEARGYLEMIAEQVDQEWGATPQQSIDFAVSAGKIARELGLSKEAVKGFIASRIVATSYQREEIDIDRIAREQVFPEILNQISERKRQVLVYRFGLEEEHAHTIKETGKLFSVSPARIRQIEAEALRDLRHPRRSRNLIELI